MPNSTPFEPAVEVAVSDDLDGLTLRAMRTLLDEVFGSAMSEHEWEHTLGGVHVLVWEGDQLVGHASVVPRLLLHEGRALRAGYVEGLAVRTDRRGQGYAASMMDELERVICGAYELGALGASEMGAGFYAARGWQAWEGSTWAVGPTGMMRTAEDDGYVYVLEVTVPLDLTSDLTCEWREGFIW